MFVHKIKTFELRLISHHVKSVGISFCSFGVASAFTGFGLRKLYNKNDIQEKETKKYTIIKHIQSCLLTTGIGVGSGLGMTGIFACRIKYNPTVQDKGCGKYYDIKPFSRTTRIMFIIFNVLMGTLSANHKY